MARQFDTLTGQWEHCEDDRPYNPDSNITARQGTEFDARKRYLEFADSIFHATDREVEAAVARARRNHLEAMG